VHGSSGIPGWQSQTVGSDATLAAEVVTDVAVAGADEHAVPRAVAARSPAATAENRATRCFLVDLDRQVTCISRIRCSVPVDGH
jgi:hypothetical protein